MSFVKSLHAGTEESRSRSDILKPLVWPLGLSLATAATTGAATNIGAPSWLPILSGSIAALFAFIYVAGYVYFGLKHPDALRSENYTLRKMAIEKGLVGDSDAGLLSIESKEVVVKDGLVSVGEAVTVDRSHR